MSWPGDGYAWTVDPVDERALCGSRRLLRDLVRGHGLPVANDDLDSAELCLNEVVTNALLHTKAPCRVRVGYRDGVLRVSVADTNPCHPAPRAAVAEDESGRGLLLLDALARAWGSTGAGSGKEVWFEMGDPARAVTVTEQLIAAVGRPRRGPRHVAGPACGAENPHACYAHPRRRSRPATAARPRRMPVCACAATGA